MKLSQAAQLLHAKLLSSDAEFHGISTDTRTIEPGNLFVAIKGPNFDGHAFIAQAAAKNAAAAIVEDPSQSTLPCLHVENSIKAMGQLAAHHRSQFNIPVVGLTGSCGKTTTRALIASILSECGHTLFSESSFNNEIGVPLSVSRLNHDHQYAVFEMGANHSGEIAYLTHMVKPTVALITNAAAAHLEGFGSIEGVCRAKGEIFEGLSADGTAVLNADDPHCVDWEKMIGSKKLLRFSLSQSLSQQADIYAKDITITHNGNPAFTLVTPVGEAKIQLPLLGQHNVANALAAAACAMAIDIPLPAIKAGLEHAAAVTKRLNFHEVADGMYVIDDTYNANPLSVQAAIDILAKQMGTKILVLADMRELGELTDSAHREVGERARQSGIDLLYTYGTSTALTANTFGEKAQHFTDQTALISALKKDLPFAATILVKGSRSMKMERVVEALVSDKK
jgi:UDP-N-acetylmuramoyl-tripeptide--D-alanyl-D-alanine ligase